MQYLSAFLGLIQMRYIICTAAALRLVTQVTLCMQRREQRRAECLVSQHCFQFRDNSRREGQRPCRGYSNIVTSRALRGTDIYYKFLLSGILRCSFKRPAANIERPEFDAVVKEIFVTRVSRDRVNILLAARWEFDVQEVNGKIFLQKRKKRERNLRALCKFRTHFHACR